MKDFKKQKVWEKSHSLTRAIYRASNNFPKDEMYGLTSRIRRASAPIPANIAEGCGRHGDAEFGRFPCIAMGSAGELKYHLLLGRDLGFLNDPDYESLSMELTEVKRMLTGFIKKLNADR